MNSKPLIWCHEDTSVVVKEILKGTFEITDDRGFADYVFWPSVDVCEGLRFPRVKLFVTNCTNADHLACPDRFKLYFRTSEMLSDVWATAEHTMALLMQACRRVRDRSEFRRELRRMPIKMFGDGRIAFQVKRLLEPFEVKYVDTIQDAHATLILTRSLEGEDFSLRKIVGILVNTSRDKLFSEDDDYEMIHWLDDKPERVYATDFRPSKEGLRNHPRCIWTDHIGGYTYESTLKTQRIVLDMLIDRVKNNTNG